MEAYILDSVDLSIKDLQQFDDYSFNEDIDCEGKSEIVVPYMPNVTDDDFVVCKDGNSKVFVGIAQDCSTSEDSGYKITLKEANCFFDRSIFVGNDTVIASTGIEDFIKNEITANWINSGDSLLDKDWLSVVALTHTPISAKASSIGSVENGVYNLKSFIGNCMEKYGVVLDFVFAPNQSGVTVNIKVDSATTVPIDTSISDITDYVEEYSTDVLAKLAVKWKNTTTEAVSNATYFLKTDRTITTNASDPNRAQGSIKSIYVEAENQSAMQESALQEFKSNSYQHKITLSLAKDSRAYPSDQYYVGRKVRIKTKTGITETLVTARSYGDSEYIALAFGKLKVTLIEKLRSLKK